MISRAKACKTVADSLIYQLNSKWDKRTASNYRVTFTGLKDYAKYLKIRDLLVGRQIPGFTNVTERYQSKDSLIFDGEKRGTSQTIQDNIISKGFSDGKVHVLKADDSSMEIEVL